MYSFLLRLALSVLSCLLASCGGGGDDPSGHAPATSPPDATTAYVGTWTLVCKVSTPPNPAQPDGVSEDEVLTVTKDSNTRLVTSSVTSIYNNTSCSTLTSYFRSFPVGGRVEIVGTHASAADVHQLSMQRNDGSAPVKALARVQASQLFITRADMAGVALDAEGYPSALDVSRGYARAH